jgi:uncharacterized membrane protein (UPF0182 family)
MEETLEAGLAQLFGGGVSPVEPAGKAPARAAAGSPDAAKPGDAAGPGADLSALAAEARAHYERAVAAQRAGDWAAYGDELRQLGEVLQRMRGR